MRIGENRMRNIWNAIGMAMLVMTVGMTCIGCGSEAVAEEITEVEQESEESTEISAFGKAKAIDGEEIYIDFPARVVDVLVEEGQKINKGDTLMTLDYEEYKNSIESAKVKKQLDLVTTKDSVQEVAAINDQIASMQKQKEIKQSFLEESNYQIQTLQDSLKVLEDKIEKAKEDYEAEKALLEAGASTEDAVKNRKLNIDGLENEKKNTQKQIQSFKDNTKIEIEQLNTNIQGKRNELVQKQDTNSRAASKEVLSGQMSDLNIENMDAKLNKTYMKENDVICDLEHAIVEEISCEKGSYVGSNGPTYCMKLLDEDSIQIVADVPEEFINQVAIGDSCKVVPYYDNTLSLDGKVVRMDNRAVKEDGEVIVKVYVELVDSSQVIMPGLSVDVVF